MTQRIKTRQLAQVAPAAEQQEPRIRQLAKAHKSLADQGFFESAPIKAQLAILARIHSYSTVNNELIWMQLQERGLPLDAISDLRGYRVWQDAGRQVRKGEQAFQIFAPIKAREKQEDGTILEEVPKMFKGANIFDISQTDAITTDSTQDR